MEVKINKDICEYNDAFFLGMNLRQCIYTGLGVGGAVAAYFLLGDKLGAEALSWVCVAIAAPFGALGFVTYNGMAFEQLVIAMIKTYLLTPQHLVFRAKNVYYEAYREQIEKTGKEAKKRAETKNTKTD